MGLVRGESVTRNGFRDIYPPANALTKFPFSIICDETYRISWLGGHGVTRQFDLWLRFSQPARKAIFQVDYAAPAPASVKANGMALTPASNLNDFLTSNGAKYWYDTNTNRLHLMPVIQGMPPGLIWQGRETKVEVR